MHASEYLTTLADFLADREARALSASAWVDVRGTLPDLGDGDGWEVATIRAHHDYPDADTIGALAQFGTD